MPALQALTMNINICIFVICFTANFQKATTETVWLKDVTTRLQRDKRSIGMSDLPEKLTFLLKRNSDTLTLNLKRNDNVDPNADLYTVRNLDDGRSIVEKTADAENEGMAYYQDRENGAYMAAKCVRRSNGQCDVLISGNIKIGDRNYDLQPSMDDIASRNVLENTDLLGKRYILQDQSNMERDIPYIHELSDIEIDMQDQQDQFDIEGDQDFQQDESKNQRDVVVERKDNLKTEYTVKVVVVLDSSIWDLFLALVSVSLDSATRERKAEKNIRRYFSYIMNGVDQLYAGINDPNIEIHVKIRGFVVCKLQGQFIHHFSQVQIVDGSTMINATLYLNDLLNMDLNGAFSQIPEYDQAILFTRHTLYESDMNRKSGGISYPGQICVPGYRVEIVRIIDYFRTISTAAHELGHSLGAVHDGDDTARGCKAEDGFIMAPVLPDVVPYKPYSKNHWKFSTCSVEAFKRTIVYKPDLKKKPVYTQPELDEWNKFMAKLPGQKYSPSMQCQFIIGPGSSVCDIQPERRCLFMHCIHPRTGTCVNVYYSAAPGTLCGINKWCQQGECVYIRHG